MISYHILYELLLTSYVFRWLYSICDCLKMLVAAVSEKNMSYGEVKNQR